MNFKEFKQKLFENEAFRQEYIRGDLIFEVSQMIIDARVYKGLTQTQLAKMVGTHQPSIARIERGIQLPSLSFLKKIADALGTYLIPPKLGFLEEMRINEQTLSSTGGVYITWSSPGLPVYRAQFNTQLTKQREANLV